MADENAAPVEDTPQPPEGAQPDPPQPEGTPGEQPSVDWEERYQELQPAFTRATQELSQYQQVVAALNSDDPQERAAAADLLGLEFTDEEQPEEPEDQGELPPEIQELWGDYQQRQYQAQQEQGAGVAYEAIQAALAANGREAGGPDDAATQLMFDRVFELVMQGADPQQAAAETVGLVDSLRQAEVEQHQQQWAQSKRTSTPALGQEAAENQLGLDAKHSDRVQAMVESLQVDR